MTLSRIWVLHFLWLLPLAALLMVVAARQRERALARFASPDLLGRLTGPLHRGRRILKNLLFLFSLALTLFALAGPRWGAATRR